MMHTKKYILSFSFLVCFSVLSGQNSNKVDQIVSQYPPAFQSTEKLTRQIENDFSAPIEKARAAFVWIAMNVAYDTKAIGKVKKVRFSYRSEEELAKKKEQFRKDLAQKSLQKRKALCEGYSTLYQELCTQMGIECVIIPGTARRFVSEIGKTDLPSNHAWNAIRIQDKWLLVDATWAAGSVDYSSMTFKKDFVPAYFASNAEEFAMKHYPDDVKWLLTKKPLSKNEFLTQAIPYNAFLGKNLELISPANGLLETKKDRKIHFKIKNLPDSVEVAYRFRSEKYGKKLEFIQKKEISHFSVVPHKNGINELLLYFNNEPALGFKINVK